MMDCISHRKSPLTYREKDNKNEKEQMMKREREQNRDQDSVVNITMSMTRKQPVDWRDWTDSLSISIQEAAFLFCLDVLCRLVKGNDLLSPSRVTTSNAAR